MVALLADIPRMTCPSVAPLRVPENGRWNQRGAPSRCQPSPAVLRRRRIVALAALVLMLTGVWFGLQAALGRIGGSPLATAGAPGGLMPAASRTWVVRPGDTLWSIAEAIDRKGDVRPLVDRLAAEVGSTALYPGESIALPTG